MCTYIPTYTCVHTCTIHTYVHTHICTHVNIHTHILYICHELGKELEGLGKLEEREEGLEIM